MNKRGQAAYKILFFILIGILLVAGIVALAWKFWPSGYDKCDLNKDGKVEDKEKAICEENATEPIANQNPTSGVCGDGHCDINETNANCASDCNADNVPYSFFAVHFEIDPNSSIEKGDANPADKWQNLVTMVDLANQYDTKLTIMFWPGSVEYALASPERIAQVKEWQAQGHEIGLHDQGCYGEISGDYGIDKQGNPLLCDNPAACRKQADMANYEDLVSPYKLKVGTSPCGAVGQHSWAWSFPDSYLFEGRGRHDGRNSVANYISEFGRELLVLNMAAGYAGGTPIKTAQYNTLNKDEIYGFVDHGEGDAGNLGGTVELKEWLRFLYGKDPTGKKRMTFSDIMEKYVLPNNLALNQSRITQANSGECYKMTVANTKQGGVVVANGDTGLFNFGRCLHTQTFCAYNPRECSGTNYIPMGCEVTNISNYEPVEYCTSGNGVKTNAKSNIDETAVNKTAAVCGDGICDGAAGEKTTCPADCIAPTK